MSTGHSAQRRHATDALRQSDADSAVSLSSARRAAGLRIAGGGCAEWGRNRQRAKAACRIGRSVRDARARRGTEVRRDSLRGELMTQAIEIGNTQPVEIGNTAV